MFVLVMYHYDISTLRNYFLRCPPEFRDQHYFNFCVRSLHD